MPDTLTPLPPDLLESDANLTEEERAVKELLKKRAESKVSVTERNQQKVSSMMRDAITEGRKTLSERRKVKQQMPETLSRLREYRDSTAERRRNSLLERQKRHTYVQSNPLITFITFISSSNVRLPQLRGGHPEPDC
jgi:tRNA uridine 5-carbamoylmethylation protein Kti12